MSDFCGTDECAERVEEFVLDVYGRGTPCPLCLAALGEVLTALTTEEAA